ncbi:hypothetical protein NDU88_003429 [Pleurodeles waltl]|uniref:Uncharacterized protein n=1 Tax=Pleurodeles waltl TaxID=8319 RepID=A0AAV7T534_PLEWA|nr:hypothetical protein NDU88_003429 [Pleurodeles waltl]
METALLAVTEEVWDILDKSGKAAVFLLGSSEAFDTGSHVILECQLEEIGIRCGALNSLCSFLDKQVQSVSTGDFSSKPFSLPCVFHMDRH